MKALKWTSSKTLKAIGAALTGVVTVLNLARLGISKLDELLAD